MPRKLYKAHSYVNNFQGLGDVCLEWVYRLRKAPVAPYEDLIRGYSDLSEKDQEYARARVDEMFTGEELTALSEHLEKVHGIESFSTEKPLPVGIEDLEDKKVAPRGSWIPSSILMFSDTSGYDLPFEVSAYYDLRRSPVKNNKELQGIIREGREKIYALAAKMLVTFKRFGMVPIQRI